jgi:hypothetical protein
VVIYFKDNEIITREVEIKTDLPRTLILTAKQFSLGGKINYRIDEIEQGKRFRVSFSNIPGQIGKFLGVLKMNTNFPEKPEIAVRISAQYVEAQKGS